MFRLLSDADKAPNIRIGKYCEKPYSCPFKDHCWQSVKEPSVFSIPRISGKRIDDLVFRNILFINDILKGFHLSENQRRYVYLIQTGKPQVLWPAIRDELTKFVFPIDFLDFENTIDAIPLINRLYPYDAYPFQFSLHVLSRSGTLSHFEYLHQDTSDPRIDVTNKLLEGSAKNYTNDLI